LKDIPHLNNCRHAADVQALNNKLVRFDCQIVDMYEEEYFVAVLPMKDSEVVVYKYFTELSAEQLEQQQANQEPDQAMHLERANLLGQSTRCIMPWASNQESAKIEVGNDDEIITTSAKAGNAQQQCLLKLYDKNIREFKLNDFVTFIGILEYLPPPPVDPYGDSQMTEYDKEEADLPCGVPNEEKLPKLHVITYRRNLVLNSIKQLPKTEVTKDYIKEHSQQIKEGHEKVIAVLRLIL